MRSPSTWNRQSCQRERPDAGHIRTHRPERPEHPAPPKTPSTIDRRAVFSRSDQEGNRSQAGRKSPSGIFPSRKLKRLDYTNIHAEGARIPRTRGSAPPREGGTTSRGAATGPGGTSMRFDIRPQALLRSLWNTSSTSLTVMNGWSREFSFVINCGIPITYV